MKRILSWTFALAVALPTAAWATPSIELTINDYNGGNPAHAGTYNFGTITISGAALTGNTTETITVALAPGYGFDTFGYTYSGPGTITSATGVGTGAQGTNAFSTVGNGKGFDGYGNFGSELDSGAPGGAASQDTSVVFTFTGTNLSLAGFTTTTSSGAYPAYFGLHLIPLDGSTTNQAGATGPPNVNPGVDVVPEPSSLATGCVGVLAGLGTWWKRRRVQASGTASA